MVATTVLVPEFHCRCGRALHAGRCPDCAMPAEQCHCRLESPARYTLREMHEQGLPKILPGPGAPAYSAFGYNYRTSFWHIPQIRYIKKRLYFEKKNCVMVVEGKGTGEGKSSWSMRLGVHHAILFF